MKKVKDMNAEELFEMSMPKKKKSNWTNIYFLAPMVIFWMFIICVILLLAAGIKFAVGYLW